ncbi:hypothetical protein C9374_002895 [Naegleria lovaniensis]|uniref:Uncharacterized protein n=1 Tax=Naegleria lovaniensis TaxID=51637 RepID=A0AA88GTY0_NAELO|nr:uncharacterized protein C9374_002895 [Naegleria lovaniensis]KAG2385746.1 hypothetical protein C9374_002895 [Naegleria lovaniensis]
MVTTVATDSTLTHEKGIHSLEKSLEQHSSSSTTTPSILLHVSWSQKIEHTKHEMDYLLKHHIETCSAFTNHDLEQYHAILREDHQEEEEGKD